MDKERNRQRWERKNHYQNQNKAKWKDKRPRVLEHEEDSYGATYVPGQRDTED